ncbi:MAG: glycosyltransferase family 39 protein, partial [Chloroflexota bacterium]|nr:glycosyltransferase family 39 protein [Chloroflexota bacterium]
MTGPSGAGRVATTGWRGLARSPDLWAILLIVAVATAIRIAFAASAPPFIDPDGEGYYLPAHDLVAGLPFQPDLRRTPVYPFFIAAVIRLFGEDLQTLVTVQHFVVGPPSAALTFVLGRLLTGRLVALVAGLLIAVSGPFLLYEHYLLTDGPFTVLLLLTLVVVLWAARRASLGWAALGGLLFGVTILCRPAGQVLAPVLAILLMIEGGPLRRRLAAMALCGALAVLVVLPWMASNYARHGVFAVAGSGRYLLARVVKNDPGGYSFAPPPG